jgi:hypothetical protein
MPTCQDADIAGATHLLQMQAPGPVAAAIAAWWHSVARPFAVAPVSRARSTVWDYASSGLLPPGREGR